jgi:phosphatidylglycerol:prolipoprotein diacylglycerol transferase
MAGVSASLGSILAAISYHPLVHIKIGPLSLSPHGIGIAVGFLLGARLMLPAAKKRGISEDDVYALLTRAAIGAIVGARVAYVINHVSDYASVTDVLKVWQGGISLLGGFIGAILLALPEMRKRGLSFWKVMDAAAPGMALGVLIGRVGDLIVADHLGKPTSFFLGYKCPKLGVATASPCIPGQVVHQTALYDFILVAILLGVLLYLRKRERYDGFLIMVFGAWYGVERIIEDFLREDKRHLGLTGSQMTSIIVVVLCVWHLTLVRRTPRWGRWDQRRSADAEAAHDPAPIAPPDNGEVPHEEAPLEPPPTMAAPPEREE